MLYKDLTPEQQKHLQDTFNEYGEFPNDATHIDISGDVDAVVLKYVDGVEYHYWLDVDWEETSDPRYYATNTYEIPEDFCRVTGKILSAPETVQSTFPDFNFKLSCGDRPEVRQWLKDNGCKWVSGCGMFESWSLSKKYLLINTNRRVTLVAQEMYSTGYEEYFEIQPTIKVTGYTLTESSKARKETLDKLSELRNNAEVIQKQIEELEKTL